MSITYDTSVTLSSSAVKAGCTDEGNNALYLVESTGPTMRKYGLITHAQIGSNITCVANPAAITMINSLSAVIVSSSSTTFDFVEVATGYRTNTAGGATFSITGRTTSQRLAADLTLGIAMGAVTNGARQVLKIVGATQVASLVNIECPISSNNQVETVMLKPGGGSWLIGMSFGQIYEIDQNGVILNSLEITTQTASYPINSSTGVSPEALIIYGLAMENNTLLVAAANNLMIYDYGTKTQIWNQKFTNAGNNNGMTLVGTITGEALYITGVTTNNNKLYELNYTSQPYAKVVDNLITDTSQTMIAAGVNTTNGRGWALQTSAEKIRFFTVGSFVASAGRTVTVMDGGVNQSTRLILLDDTGGLGTAGVLQDTMLLSPSVVRVPNGKNIIEIVKVGDGESARYDVSRYST